MRQVGRSGLPLFVVMIGAFAFIGADCSKPKATQPIPFTPLDEGVKLKGPQCSVGDQSCGGCELYGVLDAASVICDAFADGLCDVTEASCNTYARQLFTGTRLADVVEPDNPHNGLGNDGELMADAALCALRQLSSGIKGAYEPPAVELDAIIGKAALKQRLAFTSWDPVLARWDGSRTVSFELPVLGRFDAVTQAVRLTKRRHPYVRSSNEPFALPLAGGRPIDEAFGLDVETMQKSAKISISPPPITIATPIGPVSAQPSFTYAQGAAVIDTPLDGSGQKDEVDFGGFPSTADTTVRFTDVYGMKAGVEASRFTVAQATYPQRQRGWSSQISLGNRDPRLAPSVWTPSAAPPLTRPDRDPLVARTLDEARPSASATASAQVIYPADPLAIVPSWMKALKGVEIQVKFSVTPSLRASFAAATQLGFDDGVLHTPSGEFAFATNRLARFGLLSSTGATASFGVDVRVRLKVEFDVGLFTKTLVDVDYSIANPVLDATPVSKQAVPVSVEARSGGFATAYQSFSGSTSGPSIATGITACYDPGKQPEPEVPPKPSYTPGDASDLFDGALWPCNVCIYQAPYVDDGGATQAAQMASLMPSANAASFECDREIKNGCADLCTYNPTTKQLTKVKDAEQLTVRSDDPGVTTVFNSCDLPPPKP